MKVKVKSVFDEDSKIPHHFKVKIKLNNREYKVFYEMMEWAMRAAPTISQQHQAKRVLEAFEKE